MPIAADLLLTGAAELLTFDAARGDDAGLLSDGALAARDGRIVWVGPTAQASAAVQLLPGAQRLDARGRVVLPGLVDCHSHFVFAGDRSAEFALRCEGKSYLEIAAAGGGIRATVEATTAASDEALTALGINRAQRLLAQGITTSEAKSGYGLSVDLELRQLEVIAAVAARTPLEIHPTLLGLHALPPQASRAAFVRAVTDDLIPQVAARHLAGQFDAFLEAGAFTGAEVERAFTAAHAAGLGLRLHADQLSEGGGAQLAARFGARSADHLEHVSEHGIAALAAAGVTAVLAPVATLALRERPAPCAALRAAGVQLALCTNWNPGSAPTENVWLTVSLACLMYGLSPSEALRAFTVGGAHVLGQQARLGQLSPGFAADFALYRCQSHAHLAAHAATNHVDRVYKSGQLVAESGLPSCADV